MTAEVHVLERVLQILEDGAFTATYKQAVLVALMDLCLEHTDAKGVPPDSVTTRQLAEKIVELYWPQTRRWSEAVDGGKPVLAQNSSGTPGRGRAAIVRLVLEFRERVQAPLDAGASLAHARFAAGPAYERLVRRVEWTLIEMPLPKLQRVGGQDYRWLYEINWDDGSHPPNRADVSAYQRGQLERFDNQIRFKPGVATAFVRLHGLLRPFVLHHWAEKVARLNRLEDSRLSQFLFGVDRTSLKAVRAPLLDLQKGTCFYCEERLGRGAEVDHFIPWARHPDNGLYNLVAAHRPCNGAKRDYLASDKHVLRWRRRASDHATALDQIADHVGWERGADRIRGVARAVYLGLPDDTRLWLEGKTLVPLERDRIAGALSA